jgi:hypothetical protein
MAHGARRTNKLPAPGKNENENDMEVCQHGPKRDKTPPWGLYRGDPDFFVILHLAFDI